MSSLYRLLIALGASLIPALVPAAMPAARADTLGASEKLYDHSAGDCARCCKASCAGNGRSPWQARQRGRSGADARPKGPSADPAGCVALV